MEYDIKSGNIFENNVANVSGGAIKWDYARPDIDDTTKYLNNSAIYANDIASYPTNLGFSSASRQLQDDLFFNDLPIITSYTDIAPGQIFPHKISIDLKDQYENIVKTDSQSNARLNPYDDTTSLSGPIEAIAKNGVFTFSNFVISELPGSVV